MKKIIALITLVISSANIIQSAEWIYAKEFPWLWDSENGWSYVPNMSDRVWSVNSFDWVMNPYQEAPDLSALFNQSPITFNLLDNDLNLKLHIHLSGPEYGYLAYRDDMYKMDYVYSVDELNGTALIYAEVNDLSLTATFTTLLNFGNNEAGLYTFIGNLGTSSDKIEILTGTFSTASVNHIVAEPK